VGGPRILTDAQHRERARKLTDTFAHLGPAFIKGAQVLAMREDILPPVYTRELKTLQDRVPPFSLKEVLGTIRESLGRPVEEIFDSFEEAPLAAASLGQVHRAVYKGRAVAVKVLRPGVEEIVASDLMVVRWLLRFFHLLVDSHFVRSFWAVIQEYDRMISQEMDFHFEERNAERFRRNFAEDGRLVIPRCHHELTSRRTVVFDFIDGVRVDDLEGLKERNQSPQKVIAWLIDIYVRMVVVHGFIHADPHPGNLLVDRQGRIVLLDYGMSLEFPPAIRREMLRACVAVVARDVDSMVDIFYKLGMVDPDIPRALVRDAGETLLAIQLRDDFNPRMVQEIADDILATFHRFPLRMPQQLVYLFRASALVEGQGMEFDNTFSAVREATPIIKRMIREVALEEQMPLHERVAKLGSTVWSELQYVRRVITRFEREEQRVRLHPEDLERLERRLGRLVRRLLFGFGCCSLAGLGAVVYLRTGSIAALIAFGGLGAFGLVLAIVLPFRRWEPLPGDMEWFRKIR
jgi:predicted unusual protein kinase regulating ubiquinone biosynthesis (AarF/ABC1/UbiB family)